MTESKQDFISKIMKVLRAEGLKREDLVGIEKSLKSLPLNSVKEFHAKLVGKETSDRTLKFLNQKKNNQINEVVKPSQKVKSRGESRADIKARVRGTTKPKPKFKGESRADIIARVRGTTKPKPLGGSRYTIKRGDTLSAIARKNNTTVTALMNMNKSKIRDKDTIQAGWTINIKKPDLARTIAEAKRRGLDTFTPVGGTAKAAVTAEELKKSGLSLREYLNKKKNKKK